MPVRCNRLFCRCLHTAGSVVFHTRSGRIYAYCEYAVLPRLRLLLNAQKRRGENKVCKILRIVNYVVMGAAILVVVVGMGVTSASKQQ